MEPPKIDDRIITSHELREILKEKPRNTIFSTKMPYLDKLIGGFAEGDFIVVGGAPKSGKSTLLMTWTHRLTEQKIPCLWFQIELPYQEFLDRFGTALPVFNVPRVLNVPTLTWIESKIDEAIKKYGTKVVFIDHLGMLADEGMYKYRNSVDIFDSRLQQLKRMAVRKSVCIIGVNPLIQATLRKKSTEMDTADFRGTAMIGYYADTLIGLERLMGRSRTNVAQDMDDTELLISTEMYIYIMDSRRTGCRKMKIKCQLTEDGQIEEVLGL